MRQLIVLTLMSLFVAGCEKDLIPGKLEGRYKGTFQRITSGVADPLMAQVSLHLSHKDFTGSSTIPRYPAICEGTYTTTGSGIKISNSCYFTADFDWTLIFSGDYQYERAGDSLIIWKEYPDGEDIYRLKRVE